MAKIQHVNSMRTDNIIKKPKHKNIMDIFPETYVSVCNEQKRPSVTYHSHVIVVIEWVF